jgi:hypothetical protein
MMRIVEPGEKGDLQTRKIPAKGLLGRGGKRALAAAEESHRIAGC